MIDGTGIIAESPTQKTTYIDAAILTRTASLKITDSCGYKQAGQMLIGIKAIHDKIVDDFRISKKSAHETHAAICAQEKGHLEKVDAVIKQIKAAMLLWDAAEKKRIAAEKIDAERIAREEADSRKLTEVIALEEMGNTAAAAAVMDAPDVYTPPAIAREIPKIAGISTSTTWRYTIEAEGKIPREYLMVDTAKIGRVVKAMGGATNIPGISVYPDTTMAVRS